MTLDQAAKRMGVKWKILKAMMLRAGWLVQVTPGVGMGEVRCGHTGIAGGYVVPTVQQRRIFGSVPVTVEVGYTITERGVEELYRMRQALR